MTSTPSTERPAGPSGATAPTRDDASRFQEAAARMSRVLGATSATTLDVAVEECLALAGEVTGVDVAFAVLVDEAECVTDDWNWVRPGRAVTAPAHGSPLRDTFGSVVEVLRLGHTVAVADLDEIELGPSERALATVNDLRAILLAPVRIGSTLLGLTGLQVLHEPRPWERPVVGHCEMVAQLLVQAVRRNRERGALAAIDARARRIAEYIPDGLLLLDPAGEITWASPSFIRSSGRSAGELAGLRAADLVHPDDRRALVAAMEEDSLGSAGVTVRVRGTVGWRWTDVSWRLAHEDDPAVPDEVVVSLRDVHDKHLQTEQLVRQNTHDALTGLLNRVGLEQAVAALGDRSRAVLVAYVDVDGFKAVNDAHGHAAGDRVLQQVARALGAAVRAGDLVARLGGDELCVVAVDEDDTGLEPDRLADRILAAARSELAGASPAASISVGVAGPGPAERFSALLQAADEAMYRAKRGGGDGSSTAREPAE